MLLQKAAPITALHIGLNQGELPPSSAMAVDLVVSANPLQPLELDTARAERAVIAEIAHDNEQFLAELRVLRERNVALAIGDVAVKPELDLDSGGVGAIWGANVTPISDTEWEARRMEAARKRAMPWLFGGVPQKRRRRF